MQKFKTLDANEAVANVAYRLNEVRSCEAVNLLLWVSFRD